MQHSYFTPISIHFQVYRSQVQYLLCMQHSHYHREIFVVTWTLSNSLISVQFGDFRAFSYQNKHKKAFCT